MVALETKRDEVIADFQQFYGLALPLHSPPDDLERAAILWSQLPAESRSVRSEAPTLEWTSGEYLLWQIEYQLRTLMWSLGDKKKRGARPQPLTTPAKMAEAKRKQESALKLRDELDERLREIGMEVN